MTPRQGGDAELVLIEVADDVALLTLNRPERLNAWTPELQSRYFDLLEECASRADVRAIVLTGAGRGFCAGADMQHLGQLMQAGGELPTQRQAGDSGEVSDASAAGGRSDASAAGRSDASAGGRSDASAGGRSDASAGGRSDASAGGRPDASAGGRPDAPAGGRSDASAGGRSSGPPGEPAGQRPVGLPDERPVSFPLSIPKPIMAAINGPCAGLGLVYAVMCDVRFAAAGAKITTAFSRRGLVAEHGISWMLPRLIGPARALDLLLSGRVILGTEAAELGLVNRAVEDDRLLEEAMAYARMLARECSPASMAHMKRQVYGDLERTLTDSVERANHLMLASFTGPDFAEGVQSFLERRAPKFAPFDGTALADTPPASPAGTNPASPAGTNAASPAADPTAAGTAPAPSGPSTTTPAGTPPAPSSPSTNPTAAAGTAPAPSGPSTIPTAAAGTAPAPSGPSTNPTSTSTPPAHP